MRKTSEEIKELVRDIEFKLDELSIDNSQVYISKTKGQKITIRITDENFFTPKKVTEFELPLT